MNKYEEVTNSCSDLIYAIIRKYFKGYEIEDLYQVGVIGVIKAYNNYKENQNAKFSTYAYKYIYGEIYAYINSTKIVKVSKENIVLYKKINEAKNILSQRLMKEPSIYELSCFLEIDENILETVIKSMNNIDSLDRVLYSDGKDMQIIDTIKDEERNVIYLRYYEDKTQSEVADILGLSQVGVSRSEKKTLTKIRNNYQNVA